MNKKTPQALRWLVLALFPLTLLSGCASSSSSGDGKAAPREQKAAPREPMTALPNSGVESEQTRRAQIRLELGASYYQQRNYSVAIEELKKALAIQPDYAAAFGMLGLVYMDLGERGQAESSFQNALRVAPTDSEINNNYGWFLCQTGRPKESIAYFLKALNDPLYRTPARPLHNAGICSLMLGDENAAEQYFLRSFQVDPLNPVAMYNLGEIYLKRRDIERAHFYSQRLITNFDPTAQTLWLALRVERLARNRDGEQSLAAQLRRRYPDSPEAARLSRGDFGD